MRRVALCLCLALASCTTLGPMPAVSGLSPLPAPRAGIEAQAGLVPGYYVSSAVQPGVAGDGIAQALLAVDLGRLAPGLVVGGRRVGSGEGGAYLEPLLGFRRFLDPGRRLAAAAAVSATRAAGKNGGASYEASRLGVEVTLDLRATPRWRWVELHLTGGVAALALAVEGRYCLDAEAAYGADCPEGVVGGVHARAAGLYPTATLGLAVDAGRGWGGPFHGARLAFVAAVGLMPHVVAAVERAPQHFAAIGLSLTVGLGTRRSR